MSHNAKNAWPVRMALAAGMAVGSVGGYTARMLGAIGGAVTGGAVMGYQAGRENRMDLGFRPQRTGPNLLADQTLQLTRDRCRWLCDNYWIFKSFINTSRRSVVGTGIYPIPATQWADLNEQIEHLFWRFAEGVDPSRSMSLRQSQGLFLDEVHTVGDCLAHYPAVEAWNGFAAGPAIELLDTDQLDIGFNSRGNNGNEIRQGVEYDKAKRVVAYHVLTEHPADGNGTVTVSAIRGDRRRIPATDARLGFMHNRVGQVRGVPAFVAVVQTGRTISNFQGAALKQAMLAASYGVYFTGLRGPISPDGDEGLTDFDGNPITTFDGAQLGSLPENAKLQVASPNVPAPAHQSMLKVLMAQFAAGAGEGYSRITGDYSQTTFSSERSSRLDIRKGNREKQEFVWHAHTRPYYERLIAWGILTGTITLTAEQTQAWLDDPRSMYACTVVWPGEEWVNPSQEAAADKIALECGAKSLPEICAARGRHYKDVIDEQTEAEAYEAQRRKAMGLPPRQSPGTTVVVTDTSGGNDAAPSNQQDNQQDNQNDQPDPQDQTDNPGARHAMRGRGWRELMGGVGVGMTARRHRGGQ